MRRVLVDQGSSVLTHLLLRQLLITHHPRFVVVGVLEEEDVAMTLPVASGMVTSCSTVDLVRACGTEHEDSPLWW